MLIWNLLLDLKARVSLKNIFYTLIFKSFCPKKNSYNYHSIKG